MDEFKFERRVALFTAVFVVVVVLLLVVRNAPFTDPNLVVLARIVLALAIGILGATIPGFLSVTYDVAGFAIRAAGALALFVIAFFGTPRVEALHLVDGLKLQEEITRHLANRNNCTTALTEANKLVQMMPGDAVAQNLKGNALYCIGSTNEALQSFESSEKLDPKYRPAQYNKAAALIRLGQYKRAEEILDALVKADPDYISARYNLALAQAALQKFSDATRNFEIVFDKDRSVDSSIGLGFLYLLYDGGSVKAKSLGQFKIAISLKPAAVCLLYGKLPFDPELREQRPFLDILRFVEKSEEFADVRSNFDAKYKETPCDNSARLNDLQNDLLEYAQRCCEGPK
jgi:tetratricopeptide (TPR) repeat protein